MNDFITFRDKENSEVTARFSSILAIVIPSPLSQAQFAMISMGPLMAQVTNAEANRVLQAMKAFYTVQ